jgi:23S rRNA (cytidine1920-2'-O)/16S rRNA (cytidine1409-2'-O)-methyltransferase
VSDDTLRPGQAAKPSRRLALLSGTNTGGCARGTFFRTLRRPLLRRAPVLGRGRARAAGADGPNRRGPKPAKQRADLLLVARGLAPSRERARALILAGIVTSETRRVDKAGELLALDAELSVRGQDHPFVSRGGVKLAGALDAFGFDDARVTGLVAADIGASTGGFTDCLLQRGAARVYAIDVGYGQLHDKLRKDTRVVVMERENARYLQALREPIDLVVVDASFIGLGKLLPAIARILRPSGELIALVKPQFEVGKARVGKGGVVRDEALRSEAIGAVLRAAEELGLVLRGQADSCLPGPSGNREHFLWLAKLDG